jgi:uncharacterized protein YjbI with pentapeptide repeats
MSEQQSQTTTAVAQITGNSCPHPEAVGKRWGDEITPERQAQLQRILDQWAQETDHGERKGPLDYYGHSSTEKEWLAWARSDEFWYLTGADMYWLAFQTEVDTYDGTFPNLHLEGAHLMGAHLEGADLSDTHLARAELSHAHLEGGTLSGAHLEHARLVDAHLEGAFLFETHLEGASLASVHLEGADLEGAHLEGANLVESHLEGANLQGAFFSNATNLDKAVIFDKAHTTPRMADIRWQDVNLAVISWRKRLLLGEEHAARELEKRLGNARAKRMFMIAKRVQSRGQEAQLKKATIETWQKAARAYRQLATVMRDQGMNEDADRFAYRAQLSQRHVLRRQRHFLSALGSWFLDMVAGYGYKPMRSLFTYALVMLAFAAAYYFIAPQVGIVMPPLAALVFSVTSFHGRGFTPGENVLLTNPLTVLAAGEAIIGLLIEITFIATFTQRFFAR